MEARPDCWRWWWPRLQLFSE